jgi:KDO2-lipid IV(A) lauroyltransferase
MYWILKLVAAFVSRRSDEGIERMARAVAFLAFDVLRLRRGLILKNLKLAFPEKTDAERVAIGRASMKNFALTAMEFFRAQGTDIAARIEMKGLEHVRRALDRGQGVYILCFHLGNWEAMGAAVTRHVAPAYVLVKKVGSSSVDRFVSELREKNGFLTVKRRKKGDGYAAIKEILARNEIVGFVMDQARPGEPKLPFFGHPAKTNTSLAAIRQRVPAPVMPSYIVRTGPSQHVIEFFPEIELTDSGDAAKDVLEHSTRFNAVVESYIRRSPEQYFWMHDRWKD